MQKDSFNFVEINVYEEEMKICDDKAHSTQAKHLPFFCRSAGSSVLHVRQGAMKKYRL